VAIQQPNPPIRGTDSAIWYFCLSCSGTRRYDCYRCLTYGESRTRRSTKTALPKKCGAGLAAALQRREIEPGRECPRFWESGSKMLPKRARNRGRQSEAAEERQSRRWRLGDRDGFDVLAPQHERRLLRIDLIEAAGGVYLVQRGGPIAVRSHLLQVVVVAGMCRLQPEEHTSSSRAARPLFVSAIGIGRKWRVSVAIQQPRGGANSGDGRRRAVDDAR